MTQAPKVVRTVAALREEIGGWRSAGHTSALVPTMGALHEGHLSLVDIATARATRVVVSIFVNPRQFGPREDLATYPRDEAGDLAKLADRGAHLVFAPDVGEMYPPGFSTEVTVHGLSEGLCGASRPGFFTGVATVVAKLLIQTLTDIAVFGEKDYQQLLVIRRLARDLDIPVEIVGGPVVREPDGLAMSSRNAYLSEAERAVASRLYATLTAVADAVRAGSAVDRALADGRRMLDEAGFRVDYLELRHAETLEPLAAFAPPARLLAAAWLGRTRLIDNITV